MLSTANQKTILVIAILFALSLLNGHFFSWLSEHYFPCDVQENGLAEYSTMIKIVLLVIVAPFVETYLFQHLPQQMLAKLKVNTKVLRVILPALIFGGVHLYCWIYALMAFVGGVLLNVLYLFMQRRTAYYFLIVVAFHACYNLYGYLFVA